MTTGWTGTSQESTGFTCPSPSKGPKPEGQSPKTTPGQKPPLANGGKSTESSDTRHPSQAIPNAGASLGLQCAPRIQNRAEFLFHRPKLPRRLHKPPYLLPALVKNNNRRNCPDIILLSHIPITIIVHNPRHQHVVLSHHQSLRQARNISHTISTPVRREDDQVELLINPFQPVHRSLVRNVLLQPPFHSLARLLYLDLVDVVEKVLADSKGHHR